jgi:nucleotide-binding universal stress UspA family protein
VYPGVVATLKTALLDTATPWHRPGTCRARPEVITHDPSRHGAQRSIGDQHDQASPWQCSGSRNWGSELMSTAQSHGLGPVLFCFDGSVGSRTALATAAELLTPRDAVVLTVWETIAMRLMAGGLNAGLGGTYVPDEGDLDRREEATARQAADQGAQAARLRGWEANARTEQAGMAVWLTVIQIADEIEASLIVCGARGLNRVKRAILGSVSEAVLHHSHRLTLISPQREAEALAPTTPGGADVRP